jgi:hypothetical protein
MDRKQLRDMLLTDTVVGLIASALSIRMDGSQFIPNLIAGQYYSHSIGSLAQLSLMWTYPRVKWWKPLPRWMAVFGVLAMDATIGSALAGLLMVLTGFYGFDRYAAQFQLAYRLSLIITFIFGGSGFLMETMRSKLERVTRQHERAEQLATQARLSSLESRIHPHFLFNALNSISSLVREDPDRAERLIERMASLLRFSLDTTEFGFVTLNQEMEIVRGYLEIEKARFGDRLQFGIEISEDAGATRVPPLSVQTLVENSVKFVVAPRREGGTICISALLEGNTLEVHIHDGGPGVDLASAPPGHGLDLLQSRLQVLYEGAAKLRSGRSSVTLSLPCSAPTLSTTKS